MADALIVVDVQNDFCPGGALPVPEGDRVVPVLNAYLALAERVPIPIYASRDWHPAHTTHFAQFGGLWPEHCVQGTPGAAFHRDLKLPPSTRVVTKGTSANDEGYSAFEGTLESGRSLVEDLRAAGVSTVFVGGLATDYCVLQTVLSARREGFETIWLRDASLPVEVRPGDGARAEEQMLLAGARETTVADFHPTR